MQPFKNPVAAIVREQGDRGSTRADVFDLLNIVPYIRKFGTSKSARLIAPGRFIETDRFRH